jgi:hypothetical protein
MMMMMMMMVRRWPAMSAGWAACPSDGHILTLLARCASLLTDVNIGVMFMSLPSS